MLGKLTYPHCEKENVLNGVFTMARRLGNNALQFETASAIRGFHYTLCSESEWGSTSVVLMLMLYYNTYHEHLI